ncbi:hypothetical protein [Bradyrhizobium sp. RDM4]|uniref:hypothetical protein n=1 Tax=Bradyrhizobium sp. RDM4 TaxID=3378765 RepID=UPI0038FC8058
MGERDDRLDAEALTWLASSRIADLKRGAVELVKLFDELAEDQRERLLDLLYPDLPRE